MPLSALRPTRFDDAAVIADETDDTAMPATAAIEIVQRLTRDLRQAATTLTPSEARWLVEMYYAMQADRIRAAAQMREAAKAGEPNALMTWMCGNYAILEDDIKRAMDAYSTSRLDGRWLRSITGIGPVIAGGLMAHIDIARAPSPSHIWSFAGLNPTAAWRKGEKRPWNADLKVLCWKLGQSIVKSSSRPSSQYGAIYAARKLREQELNEAGAFADQAAATLREKRIGQDTEAYRWYSQGKLPPAHLQARAERYTVKLVLSHYWQVLWELAHPGETPPAPYAIAHLGHVDRIDPPNWPLPA